MNVRINAVFKMIALMLLHNTIYDILYFNLSCVYAMYTINT